VPGSGSSSPADLPDIPIGAGAWLIIPLGDAAVLAIFLTTQSAMTPPFRLRFLLSRPALHGVATAPADRPAVSPPGWIGLFRIQRIDRFGDAVHFI
jgi:hypothetical protein